MFAKAPNLFLTGVVLIAGALCDPPTPNDETTKQINDVCRKIKEADQSVYWALEMKHKPSMNKTLLKRSLGEYNEALMSLRRIAVAHKDEVMRAAKDIFDEGLPKYFRVTFAEHQLQDNLDMNSEEIENIYVHRGKAMESWNDLHFELGIPW